MKKTIDDILKDLKQKGEAPEWMSVESYQTLSNGYLLKNETPKGMWERVSMASAKYLGKPEMVKEFFNLFWNRFLGGATPVLANMGTNRGLPISCFSTHIGDSVDSIFMKNHELAMLTKNGGGVGIYLGDVRGRNSDISGNGVSEGIIPWAKVYDTTSVAVSQGSTRRGAIATYLPIEHIDIEEFIQIRRQTGDPNRRCLNSNHAVCISDDFMNKLEAGDEKAKEIWKELLITRSETGEPYFFFIGNANKHLSEAYVKNKHKFPRLNGDHDKDIKYKDTTNPIVTSNICTEIMLYTDIFHTFVCCLSSMILTTYRQWKGTDAVYYATWFLEGVMQEFINRAKGKIGFEAALNSAIKGRPIGLGAMGWHTLLQKESLALESLQAKFLDTEIWSYIDSETKRASQDMAKEYGEPEWCEGTGMRHTHRIAIAPTVSNSTIVSTVDELVSPSIEPLAANAFRQASAKGTFIRKNSVLESLLEKKGQNISDVWKSIIANEGSVQHLDFLDENEKAVFLTAREINQFSLVRLAANRGKFIDQGQSLNLFFPVNASPKYISDVHKEAWKLGLKSLYYFRSSSVLKSDSGSRGYERKVEECSWCEG